MAFIRFVRVIRFALSVGSGIGESLMAVRADAVAENDGAAERTMARIASVGSCEGGSDGDGLWKKSGCALSVYS
jgi:hypothetical protein